MYTWILILSLVGVNSVGVAVDHVPGFATKSDCEKAGEEWSAGFEGAVVSRTAVCVRQAAPQ